MSRYVKQFSFNGDPNVLINMTNQFFSSKGFNYKKYKGEWIYQKGIGLLVGPKFVKAWYNGTAFQLEAWIKTAAMPFVFVGEENLDGFAGFATKKPLKDMVEDFEAQLMQAGCQVFDPSAPVQPTVTPAEPVAPVQPAAPAEPVAPVQPTVTAQPTVTVQEPVQPVAPAEPEVPVEPAEPVVPVEPAEPVVPVEPAEPVVPVESAESEAPVQTEVPAEEVKSKNNFCHMCGNKVIPGSRFCNNCGIKFE